MEQDDLKTKQAVPEDTTVTAEKGESKPVEPKDAATQPDVTSDNKKRAAAESNPQPAKKVKRKHQDPQVLATRRKIQVCCSTNDLATALETYRSALEQNIRIEPQIFYSLLNLCDGLDRKVHIGTPKPDNNNKDTAKAAATNGNDETTEDPPPIIRPVDLKTRQEAAFQIKEQMAKQSIPLNEQAYSALVKILARSKQVELADSVLSEAEGVQQCRVKLRLYSTLLVAYCELGRLLPALLLWERLAKRELVLTEREYAALIDCCARVGAGDVLQKVLTDLSEDVLVPAKETCQAIVKWFESPAATQEPTAEATNGDKTTESSATNGQSKETTNEIVTDENESAKTTDSNAPNDQTTMEELTTSNEPDTISSVLARIPLPPNQKYAVEPIGPVHCSSPWTISHGAKINTQTGTLEEGCLKGETLQPVQLTERAWKEMLEMNDKIVQSGKLDQDKSGVQGGRKGRKRQLGKQDQEERKRSWLDFTGYLQHEKQLRESNNYTTTFDVVMDGANIGYFQQNFAGSPKHVDYDQIDTVVQHFQKERKRILLVMHQRHFAPTLMPRRFRPLIQSWERAGILCKSPAGMNDDWYWMQAALVSGPGTLVVTNDEMRDHFFQMLAPRSFLRWKERNQVHFHFGGDDPYGQPTVRSAGRRPVVLIYPEIYSRRIQRVADGYVIPHPKRGDENRFLDGSHFVDEDASAEETYLCIRPATSVAAESEAGK